VLIAHCVTVGETSAAVAANLTMVEVGGYDRQPLYISAQVLVNLCLDFFIASMILTIRLPSIMQYGGTKHFHEGLTSSTLQALESPADVTWEGRGIPDS
jgi:hypothetical protein